jgi:hypothetical protein
MRSQGKAGTQVKPLGFLTESQARLPGEFNF